MSFVPTSEVEEPFLVIPSISGRWHWQWDAFCGPGGLSIWTPKRHDLGLCFQGIFLQIPAFVTLAVVSAYYFGKHVDFVRRGRAQLIAINIRCLIIAASACLPILQIYVYLNKTDEHIEPVSYFLYAVEGITWLTHLGYTWSLRKKLGPSPRGPLIVGVVWTIIFMLDVVSLRTHLLIYHDAAQKNYSIYAAYGFSLCNLLLQILYGLTLLPGENSTTVPVVPSTLIGESTALLGSTAFDRFIEEHDPAYLGVAMEDCSLLSKVLFYWVNPLMVKGVKYKLNSPDDLYDLPVSLSCSTVSAKLEKALVGNIDEVQKKVNQQYEEQSSSSTAAIFTPDVMFSKAKYHVSLLRALHRCFWFQFYSIGILKLIADTAGFAGPMLLNKLVAFIENREESPSEGYLYAFGLFLTTLTAAFCNSHFNFLMSVVGLKIRASLVAAIYRKTLSVGTTVLNGAFSVGEIINFMSTDTDRIVNSCPSFHALWSIPLQLGVTLYLLYLQVGSAFVAGITFSIVLIPINKCIATKIGQLSTKLMEKKDGRVKMMMEVLKGIKTIKLHCWEQHFVRVVNELRADEIKYLKGRKYLDALCVYFWATTPVLISILTFSTYVLMGNQLTAATVFTTMALLNMLISPLNAFPWVLNGLTEAWVSIKRIQRLFLLPDLNYEEYYRPVEDFEDGFDVVLKGVQYTWDKSLTAEEREKLHVAHKRIKGKGKGKKSPGHVSQLPNIVENTGASGEYVFTLYDITLFVKKGEFLGVVGPVGSGKSSLLAGILAELTKEAGTIGVHDLEYGFGYVSQQPWLQRGTIRDNILFGKPYEESKYKTVLKVCCLDEDIELLPNRDQTGVGEGGNTLSGGQRARVALARAVYQDKSIYLFDDIVSAVDPKVARHIFQHCIHGYLRNKTRVMCTHHVQYLIHADRICFLEQGKIKWQGKPAEVLKNVDDFLPVDLELGESDASSNFSSFADSCQTEDADERDTDSVLNDEVGEVGSIQMNVYASYWGAMGYLLCISIFLSFLLMQTSRNMSDWWLSFWVTNAVNSSNATNRSVEGQLSVQNVFSQPVNNSVEYYLTVYCVFAVLNTTFTLFRAFLFAYGGITAATALHKMLLKSVIKARSTFFDISPVGRILNRFSSDTYTVDDSLPFILNILLAQIFGLIGCVIIMIYGLPWLCLVLFPLIPVYHWLQHYYRCTSRELKRLSSVTLSPVYNHFNETLQGLVTIRALRTTQRFKIDNEDKIEANLKAQFASQAAAQWLGLRLQFIGVAMVTGICFIAVIQHQYDVADPGLIGLAITYALSVTSLLNGVINAFTETEREMVAVERVNQYVQEIRPENAGFVMEPPFAWPSHGVVRFQNVVLKYREHLVPSLKVVSFATNPAEKIGVVGRTGAGKSSLLAAMFRLVELSAGEIWIDTVNISHISLKALRSRLWCIPQEPFLFSGTIRENLDPTGNFRDTEIRAALTKANLADIVQRMGDLDGKIAAGGTNLSVGQRQLFCLGRAVLHNAKVLCIDEATANVDHETDRQIQLILKSCFRKSTVITIAHRVQTVLDCDRILVMQDGQLVEFNTPDELLSDPTSYLFRIVNQEM